MKKIILTLITLAMLLPAASFAGDRFGRSFERAFGTVLRIGSAIIVTDVVNQAVNPHSYRTLYYESTPVVYTAPVYYDFFDRHDRDRRVYYRGYIDGYNHGFDDGYDERYYDGSRKYYKRY